MLCCLDLSFELMDWMCLLLGLQGKDSRVATNQILQEEQCGGWGGWDLCESEHGWSTLPQKDWLESLQGISWTTQSFRNHVQVGHRWDTNFHCCLLLLLCCGVVNETSLNENNLNWVLLDQVSTLKERVIRGLNMLLHMKTRMVTGC